MSRIRSGCLLLCLAVGCARDRSPQQISVLAASSLTESFEELAKAWEDAHPGSEVELVFAGSQVLRLQIEQGAPVDVFASANEAHLDALFQAGHLGEPTIFAHNGLALVVHPDNPAGLQSFADLPRAQRLVIGARNVPVGAYTQTLFDRAGARFGEEFATTVRSHVVSEESNVRLARAKVELGEADAAIVYRTDVGSGERVRFIAVPPEIDIDARYPIAVSPDAGSPARAFVQFVQSPEGRTILERRGFRTASP